MMFVHGVTFQVIHVYIVSVCHECPLIIIPLYASSFPPDLISSFAEWEFIWICVILNKLENKIILLFCSMIFKCRNAELKHMNVVWLFCFKSF